jgi:hypothetical protein
MVLLSLAVFLLGSNYCLLSAWSGNTRMACMTAQSAAAAPVCSHCGSAAKAPRGTHPASGRSCCPPPAVAPLQVSIDASVTVATAFPLLMAVLATDETQQITSTWFGHPPLHDGQLPIPLVRALLSTRAPPLS